MSHSSENELRKRGPKSTPLKIEEKSKKEENDGLYECLQFAFSVNVARSMQEICK